jgi:hypothetical protein
MFLIISQSLRYSGEKNTSYITKFISSFLPKFSSNSMVCKVLLISQA